MSTDACIIQYKVAVGQSICTCQADFQGNPPALHWKGLWVMTLARWLYLTSLLLNNVAFCVSWLKLY